MVATASGHEPIFVAGKPLTDIWASPGLRWQRLLAVALPNPLRRPHLCFVRNDHHHFDLENLVYPVLAGSGSLDCDSIWASVDTGPAEGVWITEAIPPSPPAAVTTVTVRIEQPSAGSVAGRVVPPELADAEVVAPGRTVGMALAFDSSEALLAGYEGAVKSLVDDLRPLLGEVPYMSRRMVSDDERVKELRITRGHRLGGHGVVITLWPRNDTQGWGR